MPKAKPSKRKGAVRKPAPAQHRKEKELEFTVGAKVFTAIGVVAMVLGMAYFFKYAIEQGLLSETIRLMIGGMVGLVALGLGEWLRGKFKLYSQLITAGGLVILYLTSYASFNFYNLMSWSFSAVGMALVAILGILMAVREDSHPLAGFTQLGALFVPFLFVPEITQPHLVLGYFALLNLMVLGLSYKKTWKSLPWMVLLITQFFMLTGLEDFENKIVILAYEVFYFLTTVGVLHVQEKIKKIPCTELDQALLFLTGLATAGVSVNALETLAPSYTGCGFFLMGSLYLLASLQPSHFKSTLASSGLVFLLVGIMGQWEGGSVVLALSGLSLLISFMLVKSKEKDSFYKVLMAGIMLYSLSWLGDNPVESTAQAFWNTHLATELAVAFAGFTASIVVLSKKPDLSERWGAYVGHILSHTVLTTMLLAEWKLFIENCELSEITTASLTEFGSSGIMALYALGLLAVGIKKKSKAYRIAFLGLMSIIIAKVFLFDVQVLETFYKFISFFILGAMLLVIGYFYNKNREEVKGFIEGD